jgi:hypothetical protein
MIEHLKISAGDQNDVKTNSLELPSAGRQQHLFQGIKQAYSTFLRISQLEQHLYNSLFLSVEESDLSSKSDENKGTISRGRQQTFNLEVLNIVEAVNNIVVDFIRPLIIKESSVDELCRIIVILNEEIRSQFINLKCSQNLHDVLIDNLNRIIYDSQERLSYCAENYIRFNIQLFHPQPDQIDFPKILIESKAVTQNDVTISNGDDKTQQRVVASIDHIAQTWYRPVRDTLSLLSKLYGTVDMNVFEDVARRSSRLCIDSLLKGAKLISKNTLKSNPQLHSNLFLIRHLLLFREQLMPFEIKLQSVEKSLDFKITRSVLNSIVLNPRNIVRFDNYNGLLQFAREGIPSTEEKQV